MKDTNKNTVAYCPPAIKMIEVDVESIICQSNPYRWTTDTDQEEDRF